MPSAATEEKNIDYEQCDGLIESGNKEELAKLLSTHHPADVAKYINHLSRENSRELFYILEPKIASEVIIELSDDLRDFILEEMESQRVSEIVDHMDSDDAADVIGSLSEEDANKVLDLIPEEDTRQVKALLSYDEESAGGIMQTEVASVTADATVQEVINMLRDMKEKREDIHNIFVTDRENKLTGVLPLRRLVLELPQTPIMDIMDTEYIAAYVDQDQEEIARIFKKYDLISLPVTDLEETLVGRITIDDIVDVIEEEASEDFFKMAGAGSNDAIPMSIFKSAKKRLPWLFASCIGGIVALKIIGAFEHTLGQVVALASFIPVILGMGGNIGTQSTTIVVRGLATGSVDVGALWKIVFKEVRIGLILGIVYGVLVAFAASFIYPDALRLSSVVGISMCMSMILAAALGTMMPIILFKLGADPAVATGPFVTTSIDIIGILILFNIASVFMF